MKNDFLKNSSQRVLFSAMMVSALVGGDFCTVGSAIGKCERASAGCGGYSRYWCKCS